MLIRMDQEVRYSSKVVSRIMHLNKNLEKEAAGICKGMVTNFKAVSDGYKRLYQISHQLNQNLKIKEKKFLPVSIGHCEKVYLELKNYFKECSIANKRQEINFYKNMRILFESSNLEDRGMRRLANERNLLSKRFKLLKDTLQKKKS